NRHSDCEGTARKGAPNPPYEAIVGRISVSVIRRSCHAASSMRPHRDRGCAAQGAAGVGEAHEGAVDRGQVGDRAGGGDEDTEGIGVAALMVTATVGVGVTRQAPLCGLVWHSVKVTGRLAAPVSALTVNVPAMPALKVATAKAPTPLAGDRST